MECRCGFTCGTQSALDKHCATCPVVDGREAPPHPARVSSPNKWSAAKDESLRDRNDSRDEWSIIKQSTAAERLPPKSAGVVYRDRERGQRAFGEIVLEVPDQRDVMDHIDAQLTRLGEMVCSQKSTLDHIQRYMPQLDQGISLSAVVGQCVSASCEELRQELRRGFQEERNELQARFQEQRNELQAVRTEVCQHEVSLQDAVSRISRKVDCIKNEIEFDHSPLLHAINKLDFSVDHSPVLQAVKGLHGHHSNLLDAHSEVMEKVNFLHDLHSKLHQSHTEVLERVNGLHEHHGKMADSHSEMFDKLCGIHDHHSRLHGSHAEMMARVNALHDNHSSLVDHHSEMLDRVNGLHDHHSKMWDHHSEVKDKLHEMHTNHSSLLQAPQEPGVHHSEVMDAVNNIHSHHSKMLDAVAGLDFSVDHSVVLGAIDRLADAIGAERVVSDQSGVLWAVDRLKAELLDAISKIELKRREPSPVVFVREPQLMLREQPQPQVMSAVSSVPTAVATAVVPTPCCRTCGRPEGPCTVQRCGFHAQGRENSPMVVMREPIALRSPDNTSFATGYEALTSKSFQSCPTPVSPEPGMRGVSPSPSQRTLLMQQTFGNSGFRPHPEIQGHSPSKRMGGSPTGYP